MFTWQMAVKSSVVRGKFQSLLKGYRHTAKKKQVAKWNVKYHAVYGIIMLLVAI